MLPPSQKKKNPIYNSFFFIFYFGTEVVLKKKRHTDVDSTSREWFRWRMEQAYTAYDPDNDPIIRKLYSEDLGQLLNDAIDSLPRRCREVFILSHIEGISNKRIAEILGISLSTVENHIYNALKSLRNKLK